MSVTQEVCDRCQFYKTVKKKWFSLHGKRLGESKPEGGGTAGIKTQWAGTGVHSS